MRASPEGMAEPAVQEASEVREASAATATCATRLNLAAPAGLVALGGLAATAVMADRGGEAVLVGMCWSSSAKARVTHPSQFLSIIWAVLPAMADKEESVAPPAFQDLVEREGRAASVDS